MGDIDCLQKKCRSEQIQVGSRLALLEMGNGSSMEDVKKGEISLPFSSRGHLYVCGFIIPENETKGEKSKVAQPGSSLTEKLGGL